MPARDRFRRFRLLSRANLKRASAPEGLDSRSGLASDRSPVSTLADLDVPFFNDREGYIGLTGICTKCERVQPLGVYIDRRNPPNIKNLRIDIVVPCERGGCDGEVISIAGAYQIFSGIV